MSRQVVTIGPDGAISGLAHKQGFDLRALGKVEIERVSEVVFDTPSQRWYVKILRGPWAGTMLQAADWRETLAGRDLPRGALVDPGSGLLLFEDYDAAVEAEVACLDALRLKGVF